jgi:sugar-specific transcriptional regulator TrmB
MISETEEAKFLTQLGFTKAQAKIYLALLQTGKANAAALQKLVKMPRPVVYRTLAELQEKGLAEKEIAQPNGFRATPIHFALQNMILQRTEDFRRLAFKTEEFLRKFPQEQEKPVHAQDYKLIMINGKGRILHKIKTQLNCARSSVDLLTTLPRWLPTVEECCENYEKALSRGVKFRVIAETLNSEVSQKVNENLLSASNFHLKLTSNSYNTNSGIFDHEVAIINFFPSKPVAESPIIWTNHPSFLAMCKDQFESAWRSTRKKPKKQQLLDNIP